MMNQLKLWVSAVFLSALACTLALAAESNGNQAAPAPQASGQGQAGVKGKVPEMQIKLMKKREEARKQRDSLIKMRQQMIKAAQHGNLPVGQTTLAPPK